MSDTPDPCPKCGSISFLAKDLTIKCPDCRGGRCKNCDYTGYKVIGKKLYCYHCGKHLGDIRND